MADVRLIAAIAALAACDAAGAAPASGIPVPAGWQALPELAAAAKDGLGPSIAVDGNEAWGETARGCYGVWLSIRASGEAMADRIVEGFTTAKLAVRDVAKPAGAAGVLSLGFERDPYRGTLRARVGDERIAALACFWNQREPAACEAACKGLLGAIP